VSLVVLDTDVASALLRRRTPDNVARQLAGRIPAITFVTVGELTKWTLVRRWGEKNLATMRTFQANLARLKPDDRAAHLGQIARRHERTCSACRARVATSSTEPTASTGTSRSA
jgi:predicted nucleic acid-binding protein